MVGRESDHRQSNNTSPELVRVFVEESEILALLKELKRDIKEIKSKVEQLSRDLQYLKSK